MANIKIRANKQLFERWKMLGSRIANLKSVAQNNMDIPQEDYNEFKQLWTSLQREFDDLKACTQLWIEYEKEC